MASAMLENDAPLSLIQELLGHSSPTVTRQVYAAYEQKSLRKGFDKYNPSASEQVAELEAEQSGGAVHNTHRSPDACAAIQALACHRVFDRGG
jgi:hypothetical protein